LGASQSIGGKIARLSLVQRAARMPKTIPDANQIIVAYRSHPRSCSQSAPTKM
jgi:hypothetical protein